MRQDGTVLESISTCFTEELLQRLGDTLSLSPPVIQQALDRLVPLVINSLQNWVTRPTGVEVLGTLTRHAQESGFLTQLHTPAVFGGRGVRLMQELLGDSYDSITQPVRTTANLSEASFALLLEVAVAAVLGTFGKYAADHHLDAARLSNWLKQQQSVVTAKPLQPTDTFVHPPASGAKRPAPAPAERDLRRSTVAGAGTWEKIGGGITFTPRHRTSWLGRYKRWQWTLLALPVIGLGYASSSYLTQQAPITAVETPDLLNATTPPVTNVVDANYNGTDNSLSAPPTTTLPAGRYDPSTDTYIYTIGQPLVLTLPDGSQQRVGSNSTEYRLYHLLADPNRQFASRSLPSHWINVDRVYFTPGQATLTAESQQQLRNLASILKAFPQARIKLGGYTDSIGDEQKNLLLSQSRASTAMQALIQLGVDVSRLQAEGYGASNFVASNAGPVGRALNRRLSLQVLTEASYPPVQTSALSTAPAVPVSAAAAVVAGAAAGAASTVQPVRSRSSAKKAAKVRRQPQRRTKSGKWFRNFFQRLRGKRAQRS
jgi:outer membrane protein OmpA-like peptidoglycan-associated protein